MIARLITSTLTLLGKYSVYMGLLLWGLAWFAMSLLIFLLGGIIPALRPKPPPIGSCLPKPPSRTTSPRTSIREPAPEEKPLPAEPDNVSCTSTPTNPLSTTMPEPPSSKRVSFKPRWSFSKRRPSQTVPSPQSSLFSVGSSTLVGSPSPPRFMPELPAIESTSNSMHPTNDPDSPSDAAPSPSGSPKSRHVRLPKMKMLKTLTRKMTSKSKSDTVASSGASSQDVLPEEGTYEPVKKAASFSSFNETASEDERGRQAQPGHLRMHERNGSGEVFNTTFVNPFRNKQRRPKAASVSSEPPSPTPNHRSSASRRMLTSFHISLHSASHTAAVPDSPRSSISSASGSTAVSTLSGLSGLSSSPRSVPRTQPYGAPYYAAMPGQRPGSRPPSRRATSLTLDRPETVAEESAEDGGGNVLGLELGQVEAGKPVKAQTEPRRMHRRAAASESAPQAFTA
ncbi:hypothetical protein C8Q74DRAFT_426550 [Fomes fomentarius]|nr:hypothetical protein C8Q74DRAFT_426550 [Fomes fomentarius]